MSKSAIIIRAGRLALVGLIIGAPVIAQDCLRVESDPPLSTITVGAATLTSTIAPGTYCTLQRGLTYTLTTSSPNHETRTIKFSLSESDGTPSFSGNWLQYMSSSAVLPGWGQASMGHPGRSGEAFFSVFIGGLKTWQSWGWYDRAKRDYEFYQLALDQATTVPEQEQFRDQAEIARAGAEAHQEHLWYTLGFTAYWYLGNLWETLLLSAPAKTTKLDNGAVLIKIPRRSKKRAALQSLFYPGMGQKYNGDNGKGFLYQTSFFICGFYVLDRRLQYQLRDAEYQLSYQKFQDADTASEKADLRVQTAVLWDSREEKRKSMYKFAIVGSAVWLISLIDATVFGGATELPNKFEPDTSLDVSADGFRSTMTWRF